MGIGNKLKNMFSMSEEEFIDDVDMDDADFEEEDYTPRESRNTYAFNERRAPREEPAPVKERSRDSKVVDMRNNIPPASTPASSKAHVILKKLDRFDEVNDVADVLNEKRIVILNLETCPNDVAVRILDYLSGVAYANSGEIKRVAGRAYIITPYNVPLTGELLDGVERSSY